MAAATALGVNRNRIPIVTIIGIFRYARRRIASLTRTNPHKRAPLLPDGVALAGMGVASGPAQAGHSSGAGREYR